MFAEAWAICHPNWQCLVGKSCVWEKRFSAPCHNSTAVLLSKMDSCVNTSIHRCDYPSFACSSQFVLNILQCPADGIHPLPTLFSFIFLYRRWRSAATMSLICRGAHIRSDPLIQGLIRASFSTLQIDNAFTPWGKRFLPGKIQNPAWIYVHRWSFDSFS